MVRIARGISVLFEQKPRWGRGDPDILPMALVAASLFRSLQSLGGGGKKM